MLAGTHKAELLSEEVICFDKNKHRNGEALKTVETINRAIENDKKISFKYFYIGLNGVREYSKGGECYKRNPVCSVFNDGYYYLICYSDTRDEVETYRVDWMCDVAEYDEYIPHSDVEKAFADGALKDEMTAFGMWHDKVEKVTLVFEHGKIEDIYDKFGHDVRVGIYDKDHYYISENVCTCDLFYGWVASYGTHIRIASPAYIKQTFTEILSDVLKQYNY